MQAPAFDPSLVPSPSYVVDLGLLRCNLERLRHVQDASGAKILLALKGFAMWGVFPLIRQYLAGCCASGLHEALLAHEEFGAEVHVYSPAFKDEEIRQILPIADHVSFNSVHQWRRFRSLFQADRPGLPSPGLRINPGYSEVEVELYNPCSPGCRLGIQREELSEGDLEGIEGLHFHSLCEQNSDTLERTLDAVERDFGFFLNRVKWLNCGGGHHITRADYDVDLLISLARRMHERYGVQVYFEPGEAVALGTGYLVATVLDLVGPDQRTVILDTSATAHMPDVLEMPYRPGIIDGGLPEEFAFTYTLGGLSCLAGDVIGKYSFAQPLVVGQRLVFTDMAHYTMVKTTTFNGVPHPAIVTYEPDTQELRVIREFGFEDFKNRLS